MNLTCKATGHMVIACVLVGSGCAYLRNTQSPLNAANAAISSRFDSGDTDGWILTNGGQLLWQPAAGKGAESTDVGYILAVPSDGNPGPNRPATSYYKAPDYYHGNWTRFASLCFHISSDGGRSFESGTGFLGDVFLANGELTAQRMLGRRPAKDWEQFDVTLTDDGKWTLGGGATSLAEVLSSITDFQIRAEFGIGTDKSSLDNVKLVHR